MLNQKQHKMKKLIILMVVVIFTTTKTFAQPIGTVVAFAGPKNKVPDGWLICDGALYDRTEKIPRTTKLKYAALFDAIGVTWGGDAANKFAVPDLRGLFLRGVSEDSGKDPDSSTRSVSRENLPSQGNKGNNVGSKQNDAINDHTHSYPYGSWQHNGEDGSGIGYVGVDRHQTWNSNGIIEADKRARETRPKNANVYYIIKYN